jgi:hypothetical protein
VHFIYKYVIQRYPWYYDTLGRINHIVLKRFDCTYPLDADGSRDRAADNGESGHHLMLDVVREEYAEVIMNWLKGLVV